MFLGAIGIPLSGVHIYKDTSEFQVISRYIAARDTIKPVIDGRVNSLKLSVQRISTDEAVQNSLHIFPNPARDHANINFKIQNASSVEIKVFSSDCVEVAYYEEALSSGAFSAQIPTDSLAAGKYYCRIVIGKSILNASFIVLK